MDKTLLQLAQKIAKGLGDTRITSMIPGGQLLAQTKMSPTLKDVAKAVVYNPDTKRAFPMSPMHKVMQARTNEDVMSSSLPLIMGMTGSSNAGDIMKAQSAKDIMRQQGDDLLAAIEANLHKVHGAAATNMSAIDDWGKLQEHAKTLVKNRETPEILRDANETLYRYGIDVGQQTPKINLDQIQAATEGAQKPLLYQFSKATDNNAKRSIIDQMIKMGGYADYVPVLQRSIK